MNEEESTTVSGELRPPEPKPLFTAEQRAFIERKLLDHSYRPPSRVRRWRSGVEFLETFRQLAVYLEPRDWWIGYYRGTSHHYVCVLPCLVIRWNRR